MAQDTVSLALNGSIPLAEFAVAMGHFNALIEALSEEIVGADEIDWEITHLETGSAIAVARGTSINPKNVEKVVQGDTVVGQSMEQGQAVPYSDKVAVPVSKLSSVLNDRINSIDFITDFGKATITEPTSVSGETAKRRYTLGKVTGIIKTISLRRGLEFSLYDPLFDRAVTCSLDVDQQELIREAWGKQVTVIGEITCNERLISRLFPSGAISPPVPSAASRCIRRV